MRASEVLEPTQPDPIEPRSRPASPQEILVQVSRSPSTSAALAASEAARAAARTASERRLTLPTSQTLPVMQPPPSSPFAGLSRGPSTLNAEISRGLPALNSRSPSQSSLSLQRSPSMLSSSSRLQRAPSSSCVLPPSPFTTGPATSRTLEYGDAYTPAGPTREAAYAQAATLKASPHRGVRPARVATPPRPHLQLYSPHQSSPGQDGLEWLDVEIEASPPSRCRHTPLSAGQKATARPGSPAAARSPSATPESKNVVYFL